jgi:hypothetical protein
MRPWVQSPASTAKGGRKEGREEKKEGRREGGRVFTSYYYPNRGILF